MKIASKLKGLSTFTLVMLITGSIDSMRNLPATALFGSQLIFFFILAVLLFLIPTSLVSAELSATWTKKGGIYHWVKMAFGDNLGFLAVWLQWINTMVWYPTILSFIAGTIAYIINPALAANKFYLVGIILSVFWGLTFLNLKGIQTSARFASVCTVLGMVIPMVIIIVLAGVWVVLGKSLQINFGLHDLMPSLTQGNGWISLTAIMASFLGMELATVHVRDVHEPQKTFPKALLYSVILITVTMLLGALAIAVVLPGKEINLVEGVMQAFHNLLTVYHLGWLLPILGVMLVIGSVGGLVNWIISPAKGLLQAANNHYLPAFFTKQNKNGVATVLLISQAVMVSLVSAVFLLLPSVNASYWFLTALSTELYMLMYVLMFLAALCLRFKHPQQSSAFKIPGGKTGIAITCLLGFIGIVITVIVGFFPPAGINVGSRSTYELLFLLGIVVMLFPAAVCMLYKARKTSRERSRDAVTIV